MGDSEQMLTAARYPVVIDGTEYLMSPLTDRDITELDLWIRSYYLRVVRASLEGETNQALRDETLRIASREALGLSIISNEGKKLLASVDGLARLFWQSCKGNHKDLDIAEISQKLYNPSNVDAVNSAFNAANIAPKNPKARVQSQKKGTPAKRKRR